MLAGIFSQPHASGPAAAKDFPLGFRGEIANRFFEPERLLAMPGRVEIQMG